MASLSPVGVGVEATAEQKYFGVMHVQAEHN